MENTTITFTNRLSEDSHYPHLPQIARELSAPLHRALTPGGPSREHPLSREYPLLPEGISPCKTGLTPASEAALLNEGETGKEVIVKGQRSQTPAPHIAGGTQITLRKEGRGMSNIAREALDDLPPPSQREGQQSLGPPQGPSAAKKITRNIRVT